jgi:hypothetical protein
MGCMVGLLQTVYAADCLGDDVSVIQVVCGVRATLLVLLFEQGQCCAQVRCLPICCESCRNPFSELCGIEGA